MFALQLELLLVHNSCRCYQLQITTPSSQTHSEKVFATVPILLQTMFCFAYCDILKITLYGIDKVKQSLGQARIPWGMNQMVICNEEQEELCLVKITEIIKFPEIALGKTFQAFRLSTPIQNTILFRCRNDYGSDIYCKLLKSLAESLHKSKYEIQNMQTTHSCKNLKIFSNNIHVGIEELIKKRCISRVEKYIQNCLALMDLKCRLWKLMNVYEFYQPNSIEYTFFYASPLPSDFTDTELRTTKMLSKIGQSFRSLGKNQIDHQILQHVNQINNYYQSLQKIAKSSMDFQRSSEMVQIIQKEVKSVAINVLSILDLLPSCDLVTQLKSDCKEATVNADGIPNSIKWIICILERTRFTLLMNQSHDLFDYHEMVLVTIIAEALIDNIKKWGSRTINIWQYLVEVGLPILLEKHSRPINILNRIRVFLSHTLSFISEGSNFSLLIPSLDFQSHEESVKINIICSPFQFNEWKKINGRYLKSHDVQWDYNIKHSIIKQISEMQHSLFGMTAFVCIKNGEVDDNFTEAEFDLMQEYGIDVHD